MKRDNKKRMPIVRFAPSPTGALHLGGARVALFNYLYAKKFGGKFLIRIEDTDKQRSKKEFENQIIASLTWLNLKWDSKIFTQSKNKKLHSDTIASLLETKKAYKCFCSHEEIEKLRKTTNSYRYPNIWRERSDSDIKDEEQRGTPFSVRLKTPRSGETTFKDHVYGDISVKNSEIDDFILARSDENQTPVYNLVVVVDDHSMAITHVIRGEDHISNTIKQILIYKALNWEIPEFVHLPMILGSNKERLSKRHGATGVQEYQKEGYQYEGLLNYLAFLGWNPGTDEEIMNLDALAKSFSFEGIQKKGAIFDIKKLNWFSSKHLSIQPSDSIIENIIKIDKKWALGYEKTYKLKVVDLLKERSHSLIDLIDKGAYFFSNNIIYDLNLKNKFWDENSFQILNEYKNVICKLKKWEIINIEEISKDFMANMNLGFAKVMKPVRFIISGVLSGPPIFDIIYLIGKDNFKKRIDRALKEFKNES